MGCFVLQNKLKQTVRTLQWQGTSVSLVYREDQGRIEAVSSVDELDRQQIPYSLLLTTTKADVQKKAISLGGYGYIAFQDEEGKVAPSFALKGEQEDILGKSLKISAISHISLVVFLMALSFIVQKYFTKEEIKPVVITINAPLKQEPVVQKKQTVQVSEKKIEKIVRQDVKKSNVTQLKKPMKITQIKKIKIRKDIPATAKAPDINQMGALSALKSVSKKSNAMSLNLNGVGTGEGGRGSGGRGYGGNGRGGGGLGEGLKGGASGALPGRGLIASSPGTGSQASGAGGYGSSGSGGGRASEGGAISFRGKSGGFMTPLDDEATVESGLDRDQIAAIVQKNMGQIIYCYEMGLQGKPALKGRLTAQWVINGRGGVNISQVAYSSVNDKKVESCITAKIKNWKFPKPIGGVNVDVSYPFELRRVSQR